MMFKTADELDQYLMSMKQITDADIDSIISKIDPLLDDKTKDAMFVALYEGLSQLFPSRTKEFEGMVGTWRAKCTIRSNKPVRSKTLGFYLPNVPASIRDCVVPQGYVLSVSEGLLVSNVKSDGNMEIRQLCSHIIFIKRIIIDPEEISPSTLELVCYDSTSGQWSEPDIELPKAKAASPTSWDIDIDGIMLDAEEKKAMASFIKSFHDANVRNIKKIPLVRQMGWNEAIGKFIPAVGVDIKFKVGKGAAIGEFVKAVMTDHSDKKLECYKLLNELKIYPKFLVCLAGAVASPLMAWNKQDEGMGIDIFAGSSKGKTAIQSMAVKLIWGNISIQKSWNDTSASTWELVTFGNGVPFILDDTHIMGYDQLDMPHLLVNGNGRNKMSKTIESGVEGFATLKSRPHRNVFLFNGEDPLIPKVTANGKSVGIKGRVVQLIGLPFEDLNDSSQIEDWSNRATEFGGYFLHPWMEHLNTLDKRQFQDEVDKLGLRLRQDRQINSMQSRLITKVSILIWALTDFARTFKIDLDITLMENELMKAVLENGDMDRNSDSMIKQIADEIIERITYDKGSEIAGPIRKNSMLTNSADIGFYGVRGEFIAISKELMEVIFSDNGKNNRCTHAINVMRSDNLLIYTDSDNKRKSRYTRMTRPRLEGIIVDNGSKMMNAVKIEWDAIGEYIEE